jgi:hypothetical protein
MASKGKDSTTKPAAGSRPGTDRKDEKDAKALRELGIVGPHGDLRLASVVIEGYSLELRDGDTFAGDVASRTAFRHMLDAWRKLFASMAGKDPMGDQPTREPSKHKLDALLEKDGVAAQAIAAATEDYALQLASVVQRFLKHPTWRGVERIIIGGSFHQSEVGSQAIDRTREVLKAEKVKVELRTLRHHADDGGLIGWVHLAPPPCCRAMTRSWPWTAAARRTCPATGRARGFTCRTSATAARRCACTTMPWCRACRRCPSCRT